MCGIFATFSNNSVSKAVVDNSDLISHRGPDNSSEYRHKKCYMKFHRLAIMDRTERSNQPMIKQNMVLICNGEIFNYKELAEKYNIALTTGSDCEIIIGLFLRFRNLKFVPELNGDYAFILYNSSNGNIYVARDPYGVRPLFWSKKPLSFASEMKALSFANDVTHFSPGTHMKVTETRFEINNWYHIPEKFDSNNMSNISTEEIHEKIHDLLSDSVAIRQMSDVPIGCFLSGGLDSSLISALVSRDMKENVSFFSIGLEGSIDVENAKKVAEHLNITDRHHIYTMTVEEGFNELRNVIYALETYDITTIRASTPQYILSKYIKNNTDVRVLFSGEGADEIFAGYAYEKLAPNVNALESDLRRLICELHCFDNLRVDRTTAAWGLEVRVPFLDRRIVDFMFEISPEHRWPHPLEKSILRDSFNNGLLLDEILYRPKMAFSDAVSSESTSWYKSLAALIDPLIADGELERSGLQSKEALYYKKIFDELFPGRSDILPYYWMPQWVDTKGDPSATVIKNFQ